jgi:putative FmdB family regulatory protein
MPIYEYKCDNCGDVFEVRQKFADEPVTVHEKCGGPVHRLMSTPSFNFKGSGWYVTDYGKGNNGANKSDKDSKEGKDSKESKDSKDSKDSKESKPSTETKSEAKPSTESKPASSDKSKSE